MKISEIFSSIQGEGKHVSEPALFIRVSGCNLKCPYCDSKYHIKGKEMSVNEIVKIIENSDKYLIIWTGGEPTLYLNEIKKVIKQLPLRYNHIETNGTILKTDLVFMFDYVCFSPKNIIDANRIGKFIKECDTNLTPFSCYDIKIVTDLKTIGIDMLDEATMLMPLSTFNKKKDEKIKKNVWKYCVEHNIKYSPRMHIDVFGKKRGV